MIDTANRNRAEALIRAYRSFREPPEFARSNRANLFNFASDLPSPPTQLAMDWRTHGVISIARDQEKCQSCTAFAIAATIEAALRIANPGDTRSVDAGFLHSCVSHRGQLADPHNNCVSGADLAPTISALITIGYLFSVDGGVYPYPIESCKAGPRSAVTSARHLSGPNAAKAALLRAPIVSEMYAWTNFLRHFSIDVYEPDLSGEVFPHSVCVIGYSAVGWIIKNSMGPSWGIGGCATIPYGSCGLFAPPPANGYATDSFAIGV